ncbi:hypothetical protein HPB48_026829 [Haemaphysalis longicornis]|uniref:Uncharacterized protein n=1 Tax=Haemaphysalis longicornis TaxID=44386 RepID=A0A9J6HDC2_HAELO|nr:hypothetical protein HPB48_026829 [Haemaphysalis longicornis]
MLVDIRQLVLLHDVVLSFTKEKRHRALNAFSPDDSPPTNPPVSASAADVSLQVDLLTASTESDDELKELLTFLRIELESHEQCCGLPLRQFDGNRPEKQRNNPLMESALHVGDSEEECFFSRSKKHGTSSCSADMSLATKKERLAKDRSCFMCTSMPVSSCQRHNRFVPVEAEAKKPSLGLKPSSISSRKKLASAKESRKMAEASQEKNAKLNEALGVSGFFVECNSLDHDGENHEAQVTAESQKQLYNKVPAVHHEGRQISTTYVSAKYPHSITNLTSKRQRLRKRTGLPGALKASAGVRLQTLRLEERTL